MKKLLLPVFLVSVVAASAQTFVTGADIGYLLDDEETYYSGRIGWQFKANETYAHQLELEIGHTDSRFASFRADLTPVTVNYRLHGLTSGKFGYYVGAGAGFARASLDGVGIAGPVRLHDTVFAAQAFAGMTWRASPAVALNLGAKYIRANDASFVGTTTKIGDDVAVGGGLSFKF
jgi:opacity protein-like surface antigen